MTQEQEKARMEIVHAIVDSMLKVPGEKDIAIMFSRSDWEVIRSALQIAGEL